MLAQATDFDDRTTLDVDVCVIGTGPAGLAVALELSGLGRRVLVLESGGAEVARDVQALNEGTTIGRPYTGLAACRSRYLGGSSNCWAGMCRPLAPEDFSRRAWVPHSGWPITLDDLRPHYARAEAFLEVQGGAYDAESWAEDAHGAWRLGPDVRSGVFQLSPPTRLGTRERSTIEGRAELTVVLGATVTNLGLTANGARLERVVVRRTLGGGGFVVRPRVTILAAGGLENARLLLASRDVAPAGVGNDRDVVGRYFMEHAHTDGYAVLLARRGDAGTRFYARRELAGQRVWAWLGLTPEARAREQILDFSMVVLRSVAGDVGELVGDVAGASSIVDDGPTEACTYAIGTPSECAPDPDSRVLLGEELDPLGMPRIVLDWRLSELDKRTITRGHALVGAAIARSGEGRLRLLLPDGPEFPEETGGGCHHMGTTRMGTDPATSVVDVDGRVHGVAGLYVAGSSLFPTAGAANPTLTLTALAFRLAAHLGREGT
jgi:choline dehydrogenase-like flavoprotein